MHTTNAVPARLGLGILLLLSIFAWAPATFPGYWQATDGFTPVFSAAQPAPIAGVAVQPDLWRGEGSATALLTEPAILLGQTPTAAVRITFILAFLVGGCAMYAWLRHWLGDLGAGLAALVYILQPFFLATVYVRGSLADSLMLAWLPLALAGLTIYANERSLGGAGVAVLAIIAMWRTQAGLALLATVLLLLYVILVERHWVAAVVVAVAGVTGAATLIPIWALNAPSSINFADHFIYPHQLFGVTWAVAPSIAGWQDRYPFQLGFVVVGFSSLALWGWWSAPRQALFPTFRRLLIFAFGGVLVLLLLCMPVSALLWQVTGGARLLTYPWQLLVLAAPLLALGAGSLIVLLPDFAAPAHWSALVTLTLLASYPYLTTTFTQVPAPNAPVAVIGNDQIAVLDAALTEDAGAHTATLQLTWQVLQPLDFDYNVFFQAIAPAASDGAPERVVAQLDAQPLGESRPATRWQPGEILTTTYKLDLPSDSATGSLRYYFGYYDWRDGKRLAVDGGIDDKMVLDGQ